jgi:hypothetical protein
MSEEERTQAEQELFGGAEIDAMLEGMIALHGIYMNLRGAGFTEREACMIVADGIFGQRFRSP